MYREVSYTSRTAFEITSNILFVLDTAEYVMHLWHDPLFLKNTLPGALGVVWHLPIEYQYCTWNKTNFIEW